MTARLRSALAASLLLCAGAAFAEAHPELQAFPPAQEGMERFVIALPHKERGEDDDFRVELIVGKEMLTDGVNQVRLGNAIEARTLEGWGYTYYEVSGSSATLSTLMAPPEGAPKVKTFVRAAPLLIRYNSRLPIVVYTPRGYEVRYRIWNASDTTHPAERD
ncbi:MAG: ecotin family protein [Deltaproteobacteria bacterium]|jgi:ecotin|nr:ecotin family protein [Deltaproteobacteria bacterium]MBW2541577.1 ecotin family protein [Deltaproteobacteria bacterium]